MQVARASVSNLQKKRAELVSGHVWPREEGGGGGEGWIRRERGGVWNPKVCVPKMAQINISFWKFLFFPRRSLGQRGSMSRNWEGLSPPPFRMTVTSAQPLLSAPPPTLQPFATASMAPETACPTASNRSCNGYKSWRAVVGS